MATRAPPKRQHPPHAFLALSRLQCKNNDARVATAWRALRVWLWCPHAGRTSHLWGRLWGMVGGAEKQVRLQFLSI